MSKERKNISLDEDVNKDIEEKIKKFKFNFSEWVNLEWRKQFMSIESKQEEIKNCQKRVEILKNEVKIIRERNEDIRSILTGNEVRYLQSVPSLMKKGFEASAVWRRFNNTFKRDFEYSAFRELVRGVDDDRKRQLASRIGHFRSKKGEHKK